MPRRLPGLFAALAMAVSLSAIAPAITAACSCAGLVGDDPAAAADLVFVGAVADERGSSAAADPGDYLFAVEEVRKGPTLASVVVASFRDASACGAGFIVDTRWLVYATRTDTGRWVSSICDGNQLLSGAADLPPRAAEWPDQAEQAAQGDANPALPLQSLVMIVVVAALGIGSAVAFLWRGRVNGAR